MHRKKILDHLTLYKTNWLPIAERHRIYNVEEATERLNQFFQFIDTHPNCLSRQDLEGHLTGSAVVTTPDASKILLTHHRKLDLWIQLGGHADDDPDLANVALREAEEESSLNALKFFPYETGLFQTTGPIPIDIDVHSIPERKQEPEHWHYDVRFAIVTHEPEKIKATEESHALRWFSLDEAYEVSKEPSLHRQIDVLRFLCDSMEGC